MDCQLFSFKTFLITTIMKWYKILLVILIAQCQLTAQKSIGCLFNDLKKDDKSFAITLPGWLVRTGLNYASNHTEENDRALLETLKGVIKKVRVLVIESTDKDHSQAFEKFYSKSEKDHLELYASVKDDGNRVNIYVEEKEEIIKNLFLTVNGGKEIVLVHIKADLPLKTFKETDFSFHKNKINNEN